MKVIESCRIRNGKLELKQKSVFVSDVAKLKDGDYVITIEKQKKKRSIEQNRYYWGVVVPLVKQGLLDVGYRMTTELTHEYLKEHFNVLELINERTGEILKTIGSTTEMSTSQIMDYFTKITEWAAEYLNVQIPQPNEQLLIET